MDTENELKQQINDLHDSIHYYVMLKDVWKEHCFKLMEDLAVANIKLKKRDNHNQVESISKQC